MSGGPLPADSADFNLRDFGGYRTRSGARLRTGMLYRSGELERAGGDYEALLARLNVGHVVDFRGDAERAADRGPAFKDFAGHVLSASVDDPTVPHALGAMLGAQNTTEVMAHMTEVYRQLPHSARFRQSLALWFDALAEGHGASLIHCFAGKDRTGLAAAFLHLLMGVHRDDVFHDYLLTNAMGAGRVASGVATLRRQARDLEERILQEMMAVRPEYLAAAIDAVTETSGDPAAYVFEATGLDMAAQKRIETHLLD
jgi:protein tyrosine/serine phosphatase